jgi:ankyrin repeat protein
MTRDGWAPIHAACTRGRYACLAILLNSNRDDANLSTVDGNGLTPVYLSSQYGHVKCLARLIDKGADLNRANKDGHTAAHVTCQAGHFKCVQFLIRRGAEINKKDGRGHTPLDYARRYRQRECVHLLITNGGICGNLGYRLPLPVSEQVCIYPYLSHLSPI